MLIAVISGKCKTSIYKMLLTLDEEPIQQKWKLEWTLRLILQNCSFEMVICQTRNYSSSKKVSLNFFEGL